MRHTGIVHMRKTKPVATTSGDGNFVVTLPVIDAWGTHQREPWALVWSGPQAKAWWDNEGRTLQPGDTLQVDVEKARAHTIGQGFGAKTEIHAFVRSAQLVKRARTDGATP